MQIRYSAKIVGVFLLLVTGFSIQSAFGRPFENTKGVVIEAEIKAVSGETVTIIRASDKREFPIPISSLSAPDQEYIRAWATEKMQNPASEPNGNGSKPKVPAKINPDIKPGRLKLEFPELGVDRNDKPAAMGINIPASYDPAKLTPLFVYMGGGSGNNSPSTQSVVDGDRFITAGMPFPKGMNNAHQSNMVGDFKKIWSDYHETMLKKLFETIPNIDKRLCILAGFSNGAHCMGGVLDEVGSKGYPTYFNCYIAVEGGGHGRFKANKDSFFFVTWGETSPAKEATQAGGRKASGESMTFEMPGTGHTFAPSGKEKAKEWINTVVIPATLGSQ